MKNKIIPISVMISVFAVLGFVGHSYAAMTHLKNQGQGGMPPQGQFRGDMQQKPGISGNVSAINGTTITVTDKGFGTSSATKTYTVDASNATVEKNRATSTLSSISVGDFVMIEGTVSGTSITATKINLNNGFGKGDKQNPGKGFDQKTSSSTNMIEGNGQPIIGGTVSAVNGTTITVTNKSNTSYTIDASSATITKVNNKISVSDVLVGDSVLVQGTINGTSVTASTITDQGSIANATSTDKKIDNKSKSSGFWGGIGNFFSRLFGF